MTARYNILLVGLLSFVLGFSSGFAKTPNFQTSCIKSDWDGYLSSSIRGCILEEIERLAANSKIDSKRIEAWERKCADSELEGEMKWLDQHTCRVAAYRALSPDGKFSQSSTAVNAPLSEEIEKRLGMSLDQARDHQQVKLANGWQFHFVLTKGKRSSDDEYDGGFNFFLIDEHGAFRSSKTFTKPKHILETDGGQTAYKLNTKSFAALSVRDWVIELQETYDVEAPDEVDGAAATYFSSYSNVFLVAIDKEAYEMTLALDSLQTGLVTGLAKPSSSSAVFWDKEERLQRILVPQKGKEFPNLLVRIRQCTSSRSKTSCADTGGYKKWKNEAIYGYRDGKYEKQSKKSE